jgi:hypothetical protein
VTKCILLIWLVLIAGCQSGKPKSTNSTHALDSAAQLVPTDTVITLERTGGMSTCPVYKIMIFADGMVIYDGREYVKQVGIVRSTITQDQINQLIREFERISYFSLRDRYEDVPDGCPTSGSDSAWANTSIKVDGSYKAIRHYYGCWYSETPSRDHVPHIKELVYPKELVDLESRIDEVVNIKQWIGDTECY